MYDNQNKSAIIDSLLKLVVGGGAIATIIVAPGMAKIIDKPLFKYLDKLDKRQREREVKRMLYYLRREGLINIGPSGYEHGIKITKKGSKRLQQRDFDTLKITSPVKWDGKWRLVLFDIPEEHRVGRRSLISKLKLLGFIQLQKSAWVYPYPCRPEIEKVTTEFKVHRYVSYLEATGIDSEKALIKKFKATKVM